MHPLEPKEKYVSLTLWTRERTSGGFHTGPLMFSDPKTTMAPMSRVSRGKCWQKMLIHRVMGGGPKGAAPNCGQQKRDLVRFRANSLKKNTPPWFT